MSTPWLAFLESQGARLNPEGGVAGFGTPESEAQAALSSTVLADLSHYGLIRAEGPEAQGFLQGQFSSDLRLVSATRSQWSSYSNPKGRMLAVLRIFMQDEAYYLQLPRAILAPTQKRLQMFVMRAKVTLQDVSDQQIALGLSGSHAESALDAIQGGHPQQADEVMTGNGIVSIRLNGPTPRFLLYAPAERAPELWEQLKNHARPVGAAAWTLTEIKAGEPKVLPQTVEAFVPQMVNLEQLGGISFSKGCYPGQEIVARTHYLGSVKRRMYGLTLESADCPAPGTEVFAADDVSQPVGKLVDAALEAPGKIAALAVLQVEKTSRPLCIGGSGGPAATLSPLPYSFETPA